MMNKKILIKSNLIRFYHNNKFVLNYKLGKPNFKNFKKIYFFLINKKI